MDKYSRTGKTTIPNHHLREERERQGLSQKDLADLINVPVTRTVGRWERGESFPQPHYRRELCRILGKSAEELGLLKHIPVLGSKGQEAVLPASAEESKHFWKVPPTFTSCIGRTQDITAICALLMNSDVRLLTFLGPGGVGKTRLAVEIAINMQEYFADGICFVSLAVINDFSLVLPALAQELDIQENGEKALFEQLRSFLIKKHFLLILDNFEQVADAAPLIEKLLAECSGLKVLITSRAALHLQAEREYPLDPLALPALDVSWEPEALMQYAAVALFVQRAQAILPTFKITQQTAQAIAEICTHLDGLPLAIELSAARIKMLPVHALLAEISRRRFKLLKSDRRSVALRHLTLYNTIKWSYDLLNVEEQWLFRHLAVFAGGCPLEAVEKSCQLHERGSIDVLDVIMSLIDKSLLQRSGQEGIAPYFTMLETIREFGVDCLRANGEWDSSQRVHAMYYLTLLETAEPDLKGPGQKEWLERLEHEKENLRTALTWLINNSEAERALFFCDVFGKFCGLRGYWDEEQHWLEMVLELAKASPPTKALGRILRRAGHLAYRYRDLAKARELLEKSVALSRELGDRQNLAGALSGLGWILYRQKDITAAEKLLQESVKVARSCGDKWALANTLESLGRFLRFQGLLDVAYILLEESIVLAREVADKENLARILSTLVAIEISKGHIEQAALHAQESYVLAQELGNKPLIALALDGLADIAYLQLEYEKAAELYERRILYAHELDDRLTIAGKKLKLGDIALKCGDFDLGNALVQESLATCRSLEDNPNIAMALCILGDIKRMTKDFSQATRFYREALLIEQELGEKENIGRCLLGLAQVILSQDQIEDAARILSFSRVYLGTQGELTYTTLTTEYKSAVDRMHGLLDRETVESAWSAGFHMAYGDILQLCDLYFKNE